MFSNQVTVKQRDGTAAHLKEFDEQDVAMVDFPAPESLLKNIVTPPCLCRGGKLRQSIESRAGALRNVKKDDRFYFSLVCGRHRLRPCCLHA